MGFLSHIPKINENTHHDARVDIMATAGLKLMKYPQEVRNVNTEPYMPQSAKALIIKRYMGDASPEGTFTPTVILVGE